MSGHSKWSSIKHQKGAADAKRGVAFSKLANAITVAARNGTDPEMNFQLRLAVDRARAANMPKDNIARAIDRVKGVGGNAIEEIIFEAYGPGGTAFLIETATDNRNRSVGDIRAVLNKYDAKLAESGSVSYLFRKIGQFVIGGVNLDEAELAAIDSGAKETERVGDELYVYTEPTDLEKVRKSLEGTGITASEISLEWTAISPLPISEKETIEKVLRLSEALEELDDVVKISSNVAVEG